MFARTPALERAVLSLKHLPVGDPAAREPAATLRIAVADALRAGGDEADRVLRLLDGLDVDGAAVDEALGRVRSADGSPAKRRALLHLRSTLETSRDRVLAHVAAEPGGLRAIIDLRAALLDRIARDRDDEGLAALDDDLRAFLAARFDLGVLELRRLTWHDSAALLERLAQAEAVHAVRGWFDLKDRLDDDRRVYAFFHPDLPDIPLVFTEVALTGEFPLSIRAILNLDAPRTESPAARVAVFFSISNCERGLAGIPFGNALLKHAIDRLRREQPRLRTFATLSPIPGLRAWLRDVGEALPDDLRQALATPGWHRVEALTARVREPLAQLTARYLVEAKRADGAPLDAVTRFHVGNGATVDRVLVLADPSERGLKQSYGMMCSYRYNLERVADNQVAYALDRRVDVSGPVQTLVAEAPGYVAPPPRSVRERLAATLRNFTSRLRRTTAPS